MKVSTKTAMAIIAAVCAAAGVFGGLVLDAERVSKGAARLQLIIGNVQPSHPYTVLSSEVWKQTDWGRNCTDGMRFGKGLQLLCQLPAVWKDCSAGIYIDVVSADAALVGDRQPDADTTINKGTCMCAGAQQQKLLICCLQKAQHC